MFENFFPSLKKKNQLFVVVFAVMAIIYATGAPTDVEDPSENDETFCRPFCKSHFDYNRITWPDYT